MRILISIFVYLILHLSINAQEYKPFNLEDAEWISIAHGVRGQYGCFKYHTTHDSVINNKAYYKLYFQYLCSWGVPNRGNSGYYNDYSQNEPTLVGGLIEENKKLLFKPFNITGNDDSIVTHYNLPLNEDHLLYDFNINFGDTIEFSNNQRRLVVANDEKYGKNNAYSVLYITQGGFPNDGATWIEGIGSTRGLFGNLHASYYILNCYKSDGIASVISKNCSPCANRDTKKEEEEKEKEEEDDKKISYSPTFSPNPVQDILRIKTHNINQYIVPKEITIFDIVGGNQVFHQVLDNSIFQSTENQIFYHEIDISAITAQMLIVKVIFDNGYEITKKIIKH